MNKFMLCNMTKKVEETNTSSLRQMIISTSKPKENESKQFNSIYQGLLNPRAFIIYENQNFVLDVALEKKKKKKLLRQLRKSFIRIVFAKIILIGLREKCLSRPKCFNQKHLTIQDFRKIKKGTKQ